VRAFEPDAILDLNEAGARVNSSPQYLRKLMLTPDPPPMFKKRGRWYARVDDLDAWITRRDGGK
jgi:hypothetical protein